MAKAMYDPWSKIVTKNGYAGDEVISALQKSIRRAKEEDACMFAYEMYISSPQLLENVETFTYNFSRRYWNGRPNGCSSSQ